MNAQANAKTSKELQPTPDRLIVLTFDDACKSDVTFVGPLLKQYGFGGTFFFTECFAAGRPENYLTWDDAVRLSEMGFEIGNHTRGHPDVSHLGKEALRAELEPIERGCVQRGIPRPVSFCYPGFTFGRDAVEVLAERGYLWARRGPFPEYPYDGEGQRGPAYDPAVDGPLLIPTTGFSGPHYKFQDLAWAVGQAAGGRIAVLCFHGVPDMDHPWVHTDPPTFRKYMDYLRDKRCTVIALRDLARYVDPAAGPCDPIAALERKTSK